VDTESIRDPIERSDAPVIVDAAHSGEAPKLALTDLPPEVRKALLESFRRNEAAYRHLGR
jgi:hypothetical protein